MEKNLSPTISDADILSDKLDYAFEQLMTRYEKLIYYICRRYYKNAEDAMDAAQDAAIRIYKGLPAVVAPPGGAIKGWICAVTAHVCLDGLRKRRVVTEPLPEDSAAAGLGTAPSAEDTAGARERSKEIMEAIYQLPDNHRILVILRDIQGLSYQELAEVTGVTEGTVKSRLSRARAALRALIKKI